MYTQTHDKEPKDLHKDGKVKTQRAAPQESDKTKAAEENEQVSLSDQMKFDCFYNCVKFVLSFDASQLAGSELKKIKTKNLK